MIARSDLDVQTWASRDGMLRTTDFSIIHVPSKRVVWSGRGFTEPASLNVAIEVGSRQVCGEEPLSREQIKARKWR